MQSLEALYFLYLHLLTDNGHVKYGFVSVLLMFQTKPHAPYSTFPFALQST